MATLTTPYFTGRLVLADSSLTDNGGVQLALNTLQYHGRAATTLPSALVGRLALFYTGSARYQFYRIASVDNAGSTRKLVLDVTDLSCPWLGITWDAPADQDGVCVPWRIDDGDLKTELGSDLTIASGVYRRYLFGTVELSTAGCAIEVLDAEVQCESGDMAISPGCGLIFGRYTKVVGEDPYLDQRCRVIDRQSGLGDHQWREKSGDNQFGLLALLGAQVSVPGSCFWRLYAESGSEIGCSVLLDTEIDGAFGSRVEGAKSVFAVTVTGAGSNIGASNPKTGTGRVEIAALGTRQAGYVWLDSDGGGPVGEALLTRVADLTHQVLRINGGGSGYHPPVGTTDRYRVVGKHAEIVAQPLFVRVGSYQTGSQRRDHEIEFGNYADPSFRWPDTSDYADAKAIYLTDTHGTMTLDQLVSEAQMPETFLLHTLLPTAPNSDSESSANKDLSDGTAYGPYRLRVCAYASQIFTQPLDATDRFSAPLTLLPDEGIAEATRATVDAYAALDSTAKMYDRLKSWLVDNYDGRAAPLCTWSGEVLDFGALDVTLATDPVAVTLSGSTLTLALGSVTEVSGSIRTTGTVTATGLTFSGTIQDGAGRDGKLIVSAHTGEIIAVRGTGLTETRAALAADGSVTIPLTGAQALAGVRLVVARVGYAPARRTLDFTGGGIQRVTVEPLAQHRLSSGGSMLPAVQDLTPDVEVTFRSEDQVGAGVLEMRIGDNFVTMQQLYARVQHALVTATGLTYLAYGGEPLTIDLSSTSGHSGYAPDRSELWRRAAGDVNAGVYGNWYGGRPINGANGSVQIAAGISDDELSRLIGEAMLHEIDIDRINAGVQSLSGDVVTIRQALHPLGGANRVEQILARLQSTAGQPWLPLLFAALGGRTVVLDGPPKQVQLFDPDDPGATSPLATVTLGDDAGARTVTIHAPQEGG